jgi:hypothetical protein
MRDRHFVVSTGSAAQFWRRTLAERDRRRDENPVAPNCGRRVSLAGEFDFPADVFGFAPLHRRIGMRRNPGGERPAPLRPRMSAVGFRRGGFFFRSRHRRRSRGRQTARRHSKGPAHETIEQIRRVARNRTESDAGEQKNGNPPSASQIRRGGPAHDLRTLHSIHSRVTLGYEARIGGRKTNDYAGRSAASWASRFSNSGRRIQVVRTAHQRRGMPLGIRSFSRMRAVTSGRP